MENIEKIKKDLKQVLSERRYEHSIGVMNMAEEFAKIYKVDIETAKIRQNGRCYMKCFSFTIQTIFEYFFI